MVTHSVGGGEQVLGWRSDLAEAISLAPDHVSTYGLTFEAGTSFWSRRKRGELAAVPEETEREMYETAIDTLVTAGWEHYEVSNFARPGHRCRHNETYWLGGGYFAAGPGAASFIQGRRKMNHRSTTTYIHRVLAGESPVADSEELGPEDAARERLVFGLRRLEGVDRDRFERDTGFAIESLAGQEIAAHVEHGLLAWSGRQLRLTRAGLLISDSIWPTILRQ